MDSTEDAFGRQAVSVIARLTFGIGPVGMAYSAFAGRPDHVAMYALLLAVGVAAHGRLARGQVRGAAWLEVVGIGVLIALSAPHMGGSDSSALDGWFVLVPLASATLGLRPALGVAAVGVAHVLALFTAEKLGWRPPDEELEADSVLAMVSTLVGAATLTAVAVHRLRRLLVVAREHEAVARALVAERDAELGRRVDAEREAIEASRAKSQFLASMSHELRTPLNAIIGYSEILLEEAASVDATQDLGRIRGAGRHLLTLIDDVLDLSKIEAGRMDLVVSEFSLGPLIHELVETIRPAMARNGNTLDVELPPDLCPIHADATRVRQVLLNLLSNAAKFTADGVVTLKVARTLHLGRDAVVFRVADTGIGITPEQLARLFRPFVQADGTTSRRFGGTGLGLVLCQRFAALMEGEVVVRSEPGVGSTFSFVLPVRNTACTLAALTEARVAEADTTERPRILCVDDSPADLGILDHALTAQALHVIPCRDPRRAVELARAVRPAVITLDLHMPHRDGVSLLAELRSAPDLASIPVVVVSVDGTGAAALAGSVDGCVKKPIDRPQLATVLTALAASGAGQERPDTALRSAG